MPPPRRDRGPHRGPPRGHHHGPPRHHPHRGPHHGPPRHHHPPYRFRFYGPRPLARPYRHHPPGPRRKCCNCLIYTLQCIFCFGLCWLCRCGCYETDDHPYNPPPNETRESNDNKGGYYSIPQHEQQDIEQPSAPLIVKQDIQQTEGGNDNDVTLQ
eukprot:825826_1